MTAQLGKPRALLTLSLAGICALLLLVLVLQRILAGGTDGSGAVQVAARGPGEVSELETRRFDLPPETEYAVIATRPLFHEDRRPEQRDGTEGEDGEQAAADEAASGPPPVELTGVIITPEAKIAMLRHTEDREYVTLKEGDPLDGWTLKQVQSRRIVFDAGERQQIVELDVYTGPAGGGRRGGGDGGGDEQASENGTQVIDAGAQAQNSSAAQAIRERIERERERRRKLIEEARKRQQQSDN